jgi:hypothetical protein
MPQTSTQEKKRQLAKKPHFCDIASEQSATGNVNQSITTTVQSVGHQQISHSSKYGVAMWNSFSKDWARWSSAERFTARFVFLICTVSVASQAVLHIV